MNRRQEHETGLTAGTNAQNNLTRTTGFSGMALKVIASISMLIDHFGLGVLMPFLLSPVFIATAAEDTTALLNAIYTVCRMIGRLAFPIYCFLIAQGIAHTHDWRKYLLRLSIFAVISEVPFDLLFFRTAWYPSYQNVYFTLALAVLALGVIRQYAMHPIYQAAIVGAACYAAYLLKTDYGAWGVFAIACYWYARNSKIATVFASFLGLGYAYKASSVTAFFAVPILAMYNGERGHLPAFLFYAFYPGHILLLYFVRQLWIG